MTKNIYTNLTVIICTLITFESAYAENKDTVGVCNDCTQNKKGFLGFIKSTVEEIKDIAAPKPKLPQKDGVRFTCKKEEIVQLKSGMEGYFKELGINPKLVQVVDSPDTNQVGFELNTSPTDTNTLNLGQRKELGISDDVVELPTKDGKTRKVTTVSKKEIVFALFQHGRMTEFADKACNIQAFKDHVGIRQNTAAWTENMAIGFPDGKASGWNPKFWDDSPMPKRGAVHAAINDIFMNQDRYSMGCYSASKSVMSQGILDYYKRVRPDPEKLKQIEKAMLVDKAPLSDIEPGMAWDFVKSMTPEDLKQPGKILAVQKGVAPTNFIPGDWVYIKNTDGPSSDRSGYEGSNAIYLGRSNFDDYYGEMPNSHYSFKEKINEVYQWRYGVFTASESSQKKAKKLTEEEFNHILENPENGGILVDHRIVQKTDF
jgi:hypothetical protein